MGDRVKTGVSPPSMSCVEERDSDDVARFAVGQCIL